MNEHAIVSHDEWLAARRKLLEEEKAFTRARDALSQRRRDMPWERIEKDYCFEGPTGKLSLGYLFAGRSQLVIYHFMLGPDWETGCKSCSFWADNFNGVDIHLAHRDVALAAVSRAPYPKIEAFKKRMGWKFPWVSSSESDFNFDYHVSFTPEEVASKKAFYNFTEQDVGIDELPGHSVFYKDEAGDVYHTYSTYGRGGEQFLSTYAHFDVTPKGRDEKKNMGDWLKHHDRYEENTKSGCAACDS